MNRTLDAVFADLGGGDFGSDLESAYRAIDDILTSEQREAAIVFVSDLIAGGQTAELPVWDPDLFKKASGVSDPSEPDERVGPMTEELTNWEQEKNEPFGGILNGIPIVYPNVAASPEQEGDADVIEVDGFEADVKVDYNPQAVPKARLDALVQDGKAQRYAGNGFEIVVVETPLGKLVFMRNKRTEFAYRADWGPAIRVPYEVFDDTYRQIDKVASTYPSDLIGETYLDGEKLKRQLAWVTGLTIAINLVPFGAAADSAAQGDYGEAGLSAAADLAMFLVPIAKLAKLRPGVIRAAARTATGIEAGVGLYRGYQAIDILQKEDGTAIEAAGPAAEALLRLLGVAPDAAKALAKLGDYKIVLDTKALSRTLPSDATGGLATAFSHLKIVRRFAKGIDKLEGRRLVDSVRRSLRIHPDRNIALAEVAIDGLPPRRLVGVSSKKTPKGTAPAVTDPQFKVRPSGRPTGNHSEVKILEEIARELQPGAKGTISLYSERPICGSCEGVIRQFEERFPGIKMIITTD